MIANRAERIVKPKNCVLAFGIPLSKAGFDGKNYGEDQPGSPKRFASLFPGGWEQYSSQIVGLFQNRKPDFDNLEVKIVTNLTLIQFGELFRDESRSVISLFSHWDQSQVEFDDGFANVPSIVEKVPLDFDGVIDLCVCHPISLVEALLSRQSRNHNVRYIGAGATPAFWLPFYYALYHHLETSDVTYTRALRDVMKEFFKQIEEEILDGQPTVNG